MPKVKSVKKNRVSKEQTARIRDDLDADLQNIHRVTREATREAPLIKQRKLQKRAEIYLATKEMQRKKIQAKETANETLESAVDQLAQLLSPAMPTADPLKN